MVYPENFETKIKFDKIRQLISNNSLSDMGRELVDNQEEENFPVSYYHDARPFLARVRVEGLFLEVNELVILKNSLESLNAITRFFNNKQEQYPSLVARAGDIRVFPYILQRLDSIVSKFGTIKDSASPALANIRHSITKKQSGISRRMQALLQKAQEEGWADKDTNISIRDGRMVIPVPAAYKHRDPGVAIRRNTGNHPYPPPVRG